MEYLKKGIHKQQTLQANGRAVASGLNASTIAANSDFAAGTNSYARA